jgi:uncharacterized protein (DUF433 family)
MTSNEIIEDFPELEENQIKACFSYAAVGGQFGRTK